MFERREISKIWESSPRSSDLEVRVRLEELEGSEEGSPALLMERLRGAEVVESSGAFVEF
jgi:hypothetical protein